MLKLYKSVRLATSYGPHHETTDVYLDIVAWPGTYPHAEIGKFPIWDGVWLVGDNADQAVPRVLPRRQLNKYCGESFPI